MVTRKAIFLDLFGTLIEDHGVLEKLDEVVFKPGAIEALKRLEKGGFTAFVSICRTGMPIPERTYVEAMQEYIVLELAAQGLERNAIHFISHIDKQHIDLHPLTADVIRSLQERHELRPSQSVVVGDLMKDVKIGKAVGAATVLLSSADDSPGFVDTEWLEPDYVVEDLAEAADCLVNKRQ